METILNYNLPSLVVCGQIYQIETPQEELNINVSSYSLPLLSIRFNLETQEQCWYKPPHGPKQFQYYRPIHTNSLHLEYYPCIYTSFDLFYHALRENMKNLEEEFEDNYRRIIHDVIDKVRGIIVDESNEGRDRVEVSIDIIFAVKHFVDESILSDDCVICFEELGKEGEVMCTPCSHVFHEDCIEKWLENGHSCPICRHDLLDS